MSVRNSPRAVAETMERRRTLPPGPGDRVSGYGALGLPFESGHVLAFRRIVAASTGPQSVSVWHRDPDGVWTFYVDVEPRLSCARFFVPAVDRVTVTDIGLSWTGPHTLSLTLPAHRMHWGLRIWRTPLTRALNGVLELLPEGVWESTGALRALGPAAGRLLGVGGLEMAGRLPNGQAYRMRPRSVWRVEGSVAVVSGTELGRSRALPDQPSLGSFPVPNGGLFAFGGAVHERFDPERHLELTASDARVSRD